MRPFLIPLVVWLMILAAPTRAEPELHIVGIYEGFDRSSGTIHGPKARVFLARPGAEVILVLSSYSPVRWEVTLDPNTPPPTVVLSHRPREGRQSEVWVDGIQVPDPVRMELPLTYRPEGEEFRALVRQVPALFGMDRMTSFHGAYTAQELGFDVSGIDESPFLAVDYLAREVSADRVPEDLRPLVSADAGTTPPQVRLTEAGFRILSADGAERVIPLPLDMPEVSWSVGAVRDAATGTLYGVTLGGDGYLFAYDEGSQTWRVDRSMGGLDAQGLFLDADGRRLIMPLGFGTPGRIAIIDLAAATPGPTTVTELAEPLPGYADLYDPGNGPEPALVPVGIRGDLLLMVARADGRFGQRSRPGEAAAWRAYLADLSNRTVDLVGFGDPEIAD